MKIGDIVKLVSGSPDMTVTTGDKIVSCIWFHDGELRKGNFNREVLKPVKQKTKK